MAELRLKGDTVWIQHTTARHRRVRVSAAEEQQRSSLLQLLFRGFTPKDIISALAFRIDSPTYHSQLFNVFASRARLRRRIYHICQEIYKSSPATKVPHYTHFWMSLVPGPSVVNRVCRSLYPVCNTLYSRLFIAYIHLIVSPSSTPTIEIYSIYHERRKGRVTKETTTQDGIIRQPNHVRRAI